MAKSLYGKSKSPSKSKGRKTSPIAPLKANLSKMSKGSKKK